MIRVLTPRLIAAVNRQRLPNSPLKKRTGSELAGE
jgi:hypothetical protein